MKLILISVLLLAMLTLVQLVLTSIFYTSDFQLVSIEAGFEKLKQGVNMSSSFFMLAVLFVLFDMELVLFFPGIFFHICSYASMIVSTIFLLSTVLLTLLLEWTWWGLKWNS